MVPKRAAVVIMVFFFFSFVAGIFLVLQDRLVKKSADLDLAKFLPKKIAMKENIAIVNINGVISTEMRHSVIPREYGAGSIVEQLKDINELAHIKSVVLRINSPGGSVASVQEIFSEVMKLRGNGKKVVASFADMSASGGYYIAAACDKIMANPGSITGSIGVIMEIGNVQELFKKIGVDVIAVKSGKYKDIGSPVREMTGEEKEIFQSLIDDAYDQFVDAIAKGRSMDRKDVLGFADGRIFTGRQALKAGLIDALGGREDAIKLAAELSGIKEENIRLYRAGDSIKYFIKMFESNFSGLFSLGLNAAPKFRLEYMMW